jgi:TonB family protein
MTLLLESAIKSSIILLAALALLPLLRGRSAAFRHWLLASALGCAALVPVAGLVVPAWHLPLPVSGPSGGAPSAAAVTVDAEFTAAISPAAVVERTATAEKPRVSVAAMLRSAWIVGIVLTAGILAVGWFQLARIASRATRVTGGRAFDEVGAIRRARGIERPVTLLCTSTPSLLVTWGLVRPLVLLPDAALGWPADRLRLALLHELEHVRRGDWAVQLAADLLRALYWFNPLFWIACRRLRQESEQACDDAVLSNGVEGASYATHLVAIARDLRRPAGVSRVHEYSGAPAIARPSSLERRVKAMLDVHINRRPLSRTACTMALLAVLTVTIPVAGVAVAQAYTSMSGTIVDTMNGLLPGVTVALTHNGSGQKYQVQSDSGGRYEITGLAPGEYTFEVKLPGFAAVRRSITISAAEPVRRDLTLQLGMLQETISVTPGVPGGVPAGRVTDDARVADAARKYAATNKCSPGAVDGKPAIGGNIRVPMKLKDVKPIYPPELAASGAGGTVVLQARIGTDGSVVDATVDSTPHAALGQAALDAVRQWQFGPTMLNCVAVEVAMKVTVNFSPQQ